MKNWTGVGIVFDFADISYTSNRLSSTIDGKTECVHFYYSCFYVISVNSISVSEKTINIRL